MNKQQRYNNKADEVRAILYDMLMRAPIVNTEHYDGISGERIEMPESQMNGVVDRLMAEFGWAKPSPNAKASGE